LHFLLFRLHCQPRSTLFPYTTLFRSFDIGPGGEGLLRAGEQDAADAFVGVEIRDGAGKLRVEGRVERVERLRPVEADQSDPAAGDRKSTRLNSSHGSISYAVFCLKKK